ncbi:MAG: hypothetical protein IJV00_06150, partial [Clostridia bacterium]|nr:hypothetical protein [Clostridia bacterium]
MLISDADRNFIMNKYHRQDEPFDPFHRWDYHGYGFDPSTGLDDSRMKAGLEELRESTVGEPHALIKAKGFAYILDNMRIDVSPNDYFVGLYNWGRLLNEPFVRKWREEALREEDKEFISLMHRSGAAEIWLDVDHFVPDWDQLLSLGVPGLLQRIKRVRDGKTGLSPAQSAFYETMIVEYEALLRLLSRLADFCKKSESPKKDRVLAALENIRDGAPKTTLDALELMYIFFMVSEYVDQFQARSLGNGLDHTLRRFYYKDLADGTFTKDEIASFLAYFMLQFPAIGHPQGHPFYLGGMDELGRDTSDELTFLILDVYGELDLYNPKIQVKINPDTPDGLIDKVLKLIRAGKTSFMF